MTFRSFVELGVRTLRKKAKPIWVSEARLAAEKFEVPRPWPLWMPTSGSKTAGSFLINGRKAWNAGLQFRPLGSSIADVSADEATVAKPVIVGLPRAAELALLAKLTPSDD